MLFLILWVRLGTHDYTQLKQEYCVELWRSIYVQKNQKYNILLLENCRFAILFRHTQPHPPKKIISTCDEHGCLSACKKSTLSPVFFLRYYTLQNPAIDWPGAFWPITQERELWQIWGLCRIINSNIFHFWLIREKVNDKIFQKMRKIPFLDHFLPFSPKIGTMRIF